jgi:CHAD domain-containing protein
MTHAASECTLTPTGKPGTQAAGILRAHLTAALTHLTGDRLSGAKVHAARKEVKRARATLRLMREVIDPDHFREEDATLRRVAQMLNDARDAEVMLRTFLRLRESIKDSDPQTNLGPLHKLLLQERRRATSNELGVRLNAIRAMLTRSKERTRDRSVANDLDLLAQGMRRTYRKGRLCYRAASESRTDEQLHAWRRQVKYCGYQLEAIGQVGRKMTKRLRRCRKLADLLGSDHDLALLHKRVMDAPMDAGSALCLMNAIARNRARLQRHALDLGARIYRAKTRKFQPLQLSVPVI